MVYGLYIVFLVTIVIRPRKEPFPGESFIDRPKEEEEEYEWPSFVDFYSDCSRKHTHEQSSSQL